MRVQSIPGHTFSGPGIEAKGWITCMVRKEKTSTLTSLYDIIVYVLSYMYYNIVPLITSTPAEQVA